MARGTPTILLDEPTSALNVESEEGTIDVLKVNARTLVLITHCPSVIVKADYVIHLNGDGTVRMISSHPRPSSGYGKLRTWTICAVSI